MGTDGALYFVNGSYIADGTQTYDGKLIRNVYTGFETAEYTSSKKAPWNVHAEEIKTVKVVGLVQPASTAYWFDGLSHCATINLKNLDTSNVTSMNRMFRDCNALTILYLGDKFNSSKVTDMSGMFARCYILTSLNLDDKFDTSKVTDMSNMFRNCYALTSLNLGDKFDTSNVTNMDHMFSGCSALTSLDLSIFNTSRVTNMTEMFTDCGTSVLPDQWIVKIPAETGSLTNTKTEFYGANSTTKATPPSGGYEFKINN